MEIKNAVRYITKEGHTGYTMVGCSIEECESHTKYLNTYTTDRGYVTKVKISKISGLVKGEVK